MRTAPHLFVEYLHLSMIQIFFLNIKLSKSVLGEKE